MFGLFGREAYEILAPWSGIEPSSPALEVKSKPRENQGSL